MLNVVQHILNMPNTHSGHKDEKIIKDLIDSNIIRLKTRFFYLYRQVYTFLYVSRVLH